MNNSIFYPNNFKKRYLYLLQNDFLNAYKIGCTNNIEQRLTLYKEKNLSIWYHDNNQIVSKQGNETDVKIVKIIETDDAELYEKQLHKYLIGNKLKMPNSNYYYKEHYSKDNKEVHHKILTFFDSVNINNPT